jgi:hypothetical protein
MPNSGQFSHHLGFHIRRSSDVLEVRYSRRNANLWLPRSFRWSDVDAIEDLQRYLSGLVQGRDKKFVRYCENQGYVSDIQNITEPVIEAKKPLCRASIPWLAEIVRGHEPLTLPENTTITLRTDRNGYSTTLCAKQLVETGILTREEAQGKPFAFLKRLPPDDRMIIYMDRNWRPGIDSALQLENGDFIWNGYFFTPRDQHWHATSIIPNRIGCPASFNFIAKDWNYLRLFLVAIQSHKNITVKRMAANTDFITQIEYPEQGPTSRPISVSPRRLRSVLRGEDPLQLIGDDLFAQRHFANRCYPWRLDPRLLDKRLIPLHDRAIAARQRQGLSVVCPRPFNALSQNPHSYHSPQTVPDALERSGSNLLCYDYIDICNERAGLETGVVINAAPLDDPIINGEDMYDQHTQLVEWPPYGQGHLCTLLRDGASFWLGWQPLSEDQWSVLAQNPAVIEALRLISNIDIESRMAQFIA